MGIRPAIGWLGLLLFTTSARAEPSSPPNPGSPPKARPLTFTVAEMKAAVRPVAQQRPARALIVVEATEKPRADYEAEVYAGAPLDTALAKALGIDRGLVHMVAKNERRSGFRIARESIHRIVRLGVADASASPSAHAPRDHIDVIETEDGVVMVETLAHAGGMFASSAVHTFPRGASLDQRVGALPVSSARERLREALVVAEWAPAVTAVAAPVTQPRAGQTSTGPRSPVGPAGAKAPAK